MAKMLCLGDRRLRLSNIGKTGGLQSQGKVLFVDGAVSAALTFHKLVGNILKQYRARDVLHVEKYIQSSTVEVKVYALT